MPRIALRIAVTQGLRHRAFAGFGRASNQLLKTFRVQCRIFRQAVKPGKALLGAGKFPTRQAGRAYGDAQSLQQLPLRLGVTVSCATIHFSMVHAPNSAAPHCRCWYATR
jgi:hypothetical protein